MSSQPPDVGAPSETARWWAGLPPLLAAGFCAIGLVLVVAFVATLINLRRVYGTAESVAHTQAVIGALQRLLATAVDAETGERGFIITGREAYLEPYNRARADIAATLAQVRTLTADNPLQQGDVERLRSLSEQKLVELADAIGQRRESGLPAAQAVVMTNAGKQTMDALRAVVSQMGKREDALLAIRVAQSTGEYRSALFTASLTAALSLVAVAGLFVGTVRLGQARRRSTRLAERLRVTLTSIGDAVVVTDDGGYVTELNRAAEALTIVQRLVEAHDGTIEAHSDGVGAGSEFVLRLPMSTGSSGGAHQATELADV